LICLQNLGCPSSLSNETAVFCFFGVRSLGAGFSARLAAIHRCAILKATHLRAYAKFLIGERLDLVTVAIRGRQAPHRLLPTPADNGLSLTMD
jgi:hypothetical protein